MTLFSPFIKFSYNAVRFVQYAHLPAIQTCHRRSKHITSFTSTEDPIVVTDDGSTIVCWHPEKEFPYECTKPLPNQIVEKTSVLKSSEEDAYKVFAKKSQESVPEELAKITYTTKHRWFPRSRDKRAKKTPMDRRYL